jgi:hypothetical protein
MDDAELRLALVSALGRGARTEKELAESVMGSFGGDLPDIDELFLHIEELVLDDPWFVTTGAGVFYLPAVAEGLELTFAVQAGPDGLPVVAMPVVDTEIAWWMVADNAPLSVGETGAFDLTFGTGSSDGVSYETIAGPAGWLPPDVTGWVTARAHDGMLQWRVIAASPTPTDDQVAAISAGFDRASAATTAELLGATGPPGLRFAEVAEPLHTALACDASPFLKSPIPPLDELYRLAGLEIHGGMVARVGTNWDELTAWQFRQQLATTHQLTDNHADGLIALIGVSIAIGEEHSSRPLGANEEERNEAAVVLSGLLGIGELAQAFWWEMEDRGAIDYLEPFADALSAHLHRAAPVGLSWLRARIAEQSGDSVMAYQLLSAAVDATIEHGPAIRDLAGYEADRGELNRAHDLLQLAGAADDPLLDEGEQALVDEVSAFRRIKPRRTVARNDLCPCGSGLKYKLCHLKAGLVEFEHRAAWLHDKIIRYALRHGEPIYQRLTAAVAEHDDPAEQQWLHGPVGLDLVCWEGRAAEGFAVSRRPLLPADEAALLDPWLASRRSVYEVRRVEGRQIQLVDLIDQRVCIVDDVHSIVGLDAGLITLARTLPVGSINRSFTPMIPVDPSEVDVAAEAVTAGDLDMVAACYAQLFGRLGLSS